MEDNLNEFLGRLVRLDSKAVEFKKQSDAELAILEEQAKKELKAYEETSREAVAAAGQKYGEIFMAAKEQVRAEDEKAVIEAERLRACFESIKEDTVRDIWDRLLRIER